MGQKVNGKHTILLVDDEEDTLILLQRKLKAEGFDIEISPNGENIMDIIAHKSPDLILLDIHMNGVDGGTICQLLKSNSSTANIPIVMFSANENVEKITKQCGADAYITKPFDAGKFSYVFQHLLGFDRAHHFAN